MKPVTPKTDILASLGYLSIASRLKRLSDRLMQDVEQIYDEHGIPIQPRWFALLHLLSEKQSCSINELASYFGYSHVAILQLVKQVEKENLIVSKGDKSDKRVRRISLTLKGIAVTKKLQPLLHSIESVNQELFSQSDAHFLAKIDRIEKELGEMSMYDRIKKRLNSKAVRIALLIAGILLLRLVLANNNHYASIHFMAFFHVYTVKLPVLFG
jgi:MarR family transcriptional regulator, repressor for mepA